MSKNLNTRKKNNEILTFIFIYFMVIFSLIACGCNPVKRVLTTPKYYEVVKRQVILNGECANDTITQEVLKDTVIYKDTIVHDSFKVDMPMECYLDTIVNDFSVYLENGNIWVKWLGQVPTRTINKQTTHVVVDRAKEAILIDSCKSLELKLYDKENQLVRKNKTIFKLYIGLAFLLLFMLRKPLLKLVGL
jgi:hypothetical protein